MDALNIIQWIVSGIGAITGVAGLTISAFDYFRDSARVVVTLSWDMNILGDPSYDPNKLYGLICATNIGRRPVYINKAHLSVKGCKDFTVMLNDGVTGVRLSEGDAPKQYIIHYDEGFLEFAKSHKWNKIIAGVVDSTEKIFKSKKSKHKPSWSD